VGLTLVAPHPADRGHRLLSATDAVPGGRGGGGRVATLGQRYSWRPEDATPGARRASPLPPVAQNDRMDEPIVLLTSSPHRAWAMSHDVEHLS
jgi:hypothetical protein